MHALSEVHVLGSKIIFAQTFFAFSEPAQGLATDDVAASSTVVAVRNAHVEPVSEVHGVVWVLRAEEIAKILDDDVSVVIRFHEPIKIVQVVLVKVVKGCLKNRRVVKLSCL